MKTQLPINKVRRLAVALCLGCLALSGHYSTAAEQVNTPTSSTYGSGKNYKTTVERKSAGELSAEDLHQASLLGSQMLLHLNAAATNCLDGKADSAKPEIEKAQSLVGIIRGLLPTRTVTTVVKDSQGKEVYRDEEKVQEDWLRSQVPPHHG